MATVPAGAKTPQDRKPKDTKPAVPTGVDDGRFWFEHDDERYEFDPVTQDTLTPGEFRQNRENPMMITYMLLERVAPADALKVIDGSWSVHNTVMEKFDDYAGKALGSSLGESSGSST